ncbi:MAG: ABC transporter permease [Acidimicrobiales bacterium]
MTTPALEARTTGGAFGPVSAAFAERGLVRMIRVPSIVVPSILMPIFFVVAFSGSFAAAVQIDGYGTDKAVNWMTAWAILQGSAFSGMGAAGAAATDLENGFFDRIRLAPVHPLTVLAGGLLYSVIRAVIPVTAVLLVAFGLLDADMPGGALGFVFVYVSALGVAVVMSLLALAVVFTFKTLQSLSFAQILIFTMMFLSVGQAPLVVMDGWLHAVAAVNPITNILRLCRQGFLGDVTWSTTWPGLVSLAGLTVFFGALAIWRYDRISD